MKKIAALIPAAGYSSRMGFFKPLLSTDSGLLIERPVHAFRQAGIDDVRVIVGNKAELLIPVLTRLDVKIIMNPHYDKGMYTSVQAGVQSLGNEIDAFFFLPADYAFVLAESINAVLEKYNEKIYDVIYPVYQNVKGHPPLISAKLRECILASEPENGLKGLLERESRNSSEVLVEDEGVLIDLDSEDDYRKVFHGTLPAFPARKDCFAILQKHQVPEPVLAHVTNCCRSFWPDC